jgi:DNA transformation protein
MAVGAGFLAHVKDLLGGLGPIHAKRMFGGAGLYAGEAIFALAVDDTLYLKTDDETRDRFEAAGSHPFVYEKRDGTRVATSYWRLPDAAMDDPDLAGEWARLAIMAAGRKAGRPVRRPPP